MKFIPSDLSGVFIIDLEPHSDERGFFARTFCANEFKAHGLNPVFVQCNLSYNSKKGTVRGMHYQAAPHEETKLVSCLRGAIYDVVVDIRPKSPTFKQWRGVELTAENRRAVYVPEGFAHGFQTLADESEVFYQMGAFFEQKSAKGVRWNDPMIQVVWPLVITAVSKADSSFPCFNNDN